MQHAETGMLHANAVISVVQSVLQHSNKQVAKYKVCKVETAGKTKILSFQVKKLVALVTTYLTESPVSFITRQYLFCRQDGSSKRLGRKEVG